MTTATMKTELCTIVEPIEPVPGKFGPQYKFKASVPWTQFAPTFYVNQELMPGADTAEKREKLINTQHWAEFRRGSLLKNQDGTDKDPELEWSYRWDVIRWDIQATETQKGSPTGNDRNQRSIERQVAFKGAVDLAVGQLIDILYIPFYTDVFARAIAQEGVQGDDPATAAEAAGESPLVELVKDLGGVVVEDSAAPVELELVCEQHKTPFKYTTSAKTGVSKWTHVKADGGYCVYDGDPGAEPHPIATEELPY